MNVSYEGSNNCGMNVWYYSRLMNLSCASSTAELMSALRDIASDFLKRRVLMPSSEDMERTPFSILRQGAQQEQGQHCARQGVYVTISMSVTKARSMLSVMMTGAIRPLQQPSREVIESRAFVRPESEFLISV